MEQHKHNQVVDFSNPNADKIKSASTTNNMAQQTAVEWLIDELELDSNLYLIKDIVAKAKEMEKQQIVKAVNVGFDEGCKLIEDIKLESGEQYYTQTYGK
jgi:hypothetical protein